MPPLSHGRRYAFTTTHAGRLEAVLVAFDDTWLTVKLAKGDYAWLRLSSLTAIAETDNARGPKRNPDPVAWTEGAA